MTVGGINVKYDVLGEYRSFLEIRRRRTTARVYTERLNVLLENQSIINTIENINIDEMINNLKKAKNKNEFSQYKNAMIYFLESQKISLSQEQIEHIKEIESNTHKQYRKLKKADFQKIDRTIKHLKNKKLKMSFQTLIATGLRVSELAQITKENCTLTDDTLTFDFTSKGGNIEQVSISKDNNKNLFESLEQMVLSTKDNARVFYSANYLQQKAKHYGFKCHDLRRACAKLEYKNSKSKEQVKEKLRHSNVKTTELYLKSKVKI